MLASIIIRTLNEATHLEDLLTSIEHQEMQNGLEWEVVLVDSGSTDDTLEIATRHSCRILHITRQEFSFGRSLNMGCDAAKGDILVMISGHCVPTDNHWLQNLCQPIIDGRAAYAYGRQIGGSDSYYSECRIFAKYFGAESKIPQEGYFCNNANSALATTAWRQYRFDEELTGLEDMELSKRLVEDGGKVAYVAEACVYHYHSETWRTVERRFSREAIALQQIMPQIHLRRRDLARYIVSSILLDWRNAWRDDLFFEKALEIISYRFWQYWGSFKGNREHRILSHEQKEIYFYPH